MGRGEEFHTATARPVTWKHVVASNTGPHGRWNGSDDGEVEENVHDRLGVDVHQAKWTQERVPLSELRGSTVDEYAKPCSCGNTSDCAQCYSKAAAQSGPPVPVSHDGRTYDAPDGRHRIAGAVALGHTHIDAFVARKP